MNLRGISLVALLGGGLSVGGAVFLSFGPELLGTYLAQEDNRDRKIVEQRQAELLERNNRLIEDLNRALQAQRTPVLVEDTRIIPEVASDVQLHLMQDAARNKAGSPVDPGEAPAGTTIVVGAKEPQTVKTAVDRQHTEPNTVGEAGSSEKTTLVANLPETGPRDVQEAAPIVALPAVQTDAPRVVAKEPTSSSHSFGVFPQEKFELCGYADFSANVSITSEVRISTPNRSTPASGFRGFERTLPVRLPTEIWEGCTLAVDHTRVSGIVRIVISVVSGDGQ